MTELYTSDERAYRDELRAFLDGEIAPHTDVGLIPPGDMRSLMARIAAAGYLGVSLPTDVGGRGLGFFKDALVSIELARHSPSLAAARGINGTFYAVPIARFGTPGQHDRYLRPVLAGEAMGALAITEPGAGSDASAMTTHCRREDGGWVLTGRKHLISNSAVADFFLVYCLTDPDAGARRGMGVCVVPRDAERFSMEPMETLGLHDLGHAVLTFDDTPLGDDAVIGGPGRGYEILMDHLTSERIDIAARAYGQALRAYEEAVRHSATREQFGRPIRHFEGVSFKIAEMYADLAAIEMLVLHAARLADAGAPAVLEAATAKLYATERGFEVCDKALQVMGGLGFSPDSVVGRAFRDIRTLRFGGGTDEIMKHVIQREVYARLPR